MFSHSAPATVDAVVVGAGLVGACCGYELAARGVSVLLVDRGAVCSGGSGAGAGDIAVGYRPGPLATLAGHSRQLWGGLADRLAADLGYRPDLRFADTGAVAVARDAAAAKALRALATDQRRAGVAAERLTRAELAELGGDATAAVRYPRHATVGPVPAALAVLSAAVERGAVVVPSAPVTAVERTDTGLRVDTAAGAVSTGTLVLAAGAWSAALAELLGVRLPVRARRRHLLVTEPLPAPLPHAVYQVDATGPSPLALTPTASGAVALGGAGTDTGPDDPAPIGALRRLAAEAVRVVPSLAARSAVRALAAAYPETPDQLPIIGADPDLTGLWYATGHGTDGVGLAPATGQLLAELVTGAAPSLDPTPYAPGRPTLATEQEAAE